MFKTFLVIVQDFSKKERIVQSILPKYMTANTATLNWYIDSINFAPLCKRESKLKRE